MNRSPTDQHTAADATTASRDVVRARQHAVSSGHRLASEAAMAVLDAGGNAIDAGVAGGMVLGVVHADLVNVAGVAPIIIRLANDNRVVTIDGLGVWPAAADVEWFEREFNGEMPTGLLRTVIPAAPASWIKALTEFGTLGFDDVAQFALTAAREGFEVFDLLARFISEHEADYARYPDSAKIYLPGGRPPKVGERFMQSDLADTLQYMVDEARSAGGGRVQNLAAARSAFYEGDIARTICDYHEAHGGLVTMQDMADFEVKFEPPVKVQYSGIDFYCCGPWCQGLSLAQSIGMLGQLDLNMSPAARTHALAESFKQVFADREQWVTDPAFADVPVQDMIATDYLAARARLIKPGVAAPGMPPAGDPVQRKAILANQTPMTSAAAEAAPASADTSHICVIDKDGNMFAATPSDTSYDTPVIPGTGLSPSSRGSQSRAVAGHINALAPGKRPRLTPNPALALKDDAPFMTLGTPGGDVQVQAMSQVLVNLLVDGVDIQQAIEAPRFATYSYPSSFAPNDYHPDLLMLEKRIDDDVAAELESAGHRVQWWPDWTWKAGGVCAIVADEDGNLTAGADPRRASLALGH